jgi:hypothetical protein
VGYGFAGGAEPFLALQAKDVRDLMREAVEAKRVV